MRPLRKAGSPAHAAWNQGKTMTRYTSTSRLARVAVVLTGAAALLAIDASVRADEQGAIIRGVVRFDGPGPERKPIAMYEKRGQKSDCHKSHPEGLLSEDLLVSEKGELANVFVYIKKGLDKDARWPVPDAPAVLDNKKCMFRPRVLGVRVGQKLQIRNTDPVLHNVRSYSRRNRAFNVGQPPASKVREKTFRRPESAIKVTCDIHNWMTGWIFAVEHPFFAVTPVNGAFTIRGLPPGEYTLAAWHEKLGEQRTRVTVGKSSEVKTGFTFKPRTKK